MPSNPVATEAQAALVLKAVPSITVVAAPASDSQMGNRWIPPRNVWAGGLAAMAAWVLLHLLATFAHIDVVAIAVQLGFDQGAVYTTLAGMIGGLIAWVVPPAQRDILHHLDDEIVHIAQKDPLSNVSYFLPPVQPPPGEPAVIVPPAVKE